MPWTRLLAFILPFTFVACSSYESKLADRSTQYLGAGGSIVSQQSNTHLADNISFWDGDGVQGAPSITISLSQQRAYFYKGGQLVGVSKISTGREGYDTPPGNFKITQKSANHRSNLYGDFVDANGNVVVSNVSAVRDKAPAGTKFLGASMPYFMRIHGAIGMHAGFLPGYAASHGCIRMPERMAEIYFNNVSHGTPVSVIR